MYAIFASLVRGIRDVVFVPACFVCKTRLDARTADELVCPACMQQIKKLRPPFCIRCGRTIDTQGRTGSICAGCLKAPAVFDRAFAPCAYEGTVKALIKALKYRQRDYIAGVLGDLLIEFIREYELPMQLIDVLMPVPLHAARRRQREFNQAELLCRKVAAACGKPVETDALIRRRNTPAQAELGTDRRKANVAGAFRVSDSACVEDKNILLIDDVLTTGSTASEAAAALKNAGANIVFILTVAN